MNERERVSCVCVCERERERRTRERESEWKGEGVREGDGTRMISSERPERYNESQRERVRER